ncbi:MAG: transposase [Okeania sp. SIO3B3]|nr:transposase [Okeania sp. SIO3B3]
MRGKKGTQHPDPDDPPRRRANKRWGHGTYANDRPRIVGTVGRESGQVRVRVVSRTDAQTLKAHVAAFSVPETYLYTDEWRGYNHVLRTRSTGSPGKKEWARDDDGDGIRKCMSTRSKAYGRMSATFCVPSREFTRIISAVM